MTGFRSANHISLESFTICPTVRSNRRDRSSWKLSHQQRLINPVTLGTLKFRLVSIGENITLVHLRVNNTRRLRNNTSQ